MPVSASCKTENRIKYLTENSSQSNGKSDAIKWPSNENYTLVNHHLKSFKGTELSITISEGTIWVSTKVFTISQLDNEPRYVWKKHSNLTEKNA